MSAGCRGCRRRRRGGAACPEHPFDTLAAVNGVKLGHLVPVPDEAIEPAPAAAAERMVIWLPDSLAGAELRQQRYPCPLGPLCNYGGGGLQQLGMVITNAETGEVVHDSRPQVGAAA